MSKKILICDGDSWTAGDLIDPELFGDDMTHVNHPDNDQYRLPRVWPHKLGKLLNVEVSNISVAGSSNDAIVRRLIPNVMKLLGHYNSDDLFVIVGWSSPERKDFYFKGEWNSWETLYPAQLTQSLPNKDLEKFYKIYLKYFWNEKEFMNRYINQNLYLHYFLKSKNIDHLFFNAFYESSALDFDDDVYKKFVEVGVSGMRENTDIIDDIKKFNGSESYGEYFNSANPYIVKEFLKVTDKVFKEVSFRNFLMEKGLFSSPQQHPNDMEHQLWAKELYKNLKDKI